MGTVLGLRVRRDTEGGYREVGIAGELDLASADQLDVVLAAAMDNVMLDLTECEFMDSTGIAVIAAAWKLRRHSGGRLVCFGAKPEVARVLDVTGLSDREFIVQTREDALLVMSSEQRE